MTEFSDYQIIEAKEDWHELQRLAQSELTLDPFNINAYVFLALSYERQGFGPSALKLLSDGIAKGADKKVLRGFRVQLLLNMMRWTEALIEIWDHIEEFPEDGWGYRHAMRALLLLQKPKQALDIGQKAVVGLAPAHAEVLIEIIEEAKAAVGAVVELSGWEDKPVSSLDAVIISGTSAEADCAVGELWRRYHAGSVSERLIVTLRRAYHRTDRARLDMQVFLRREAARLWPDRGDAITDLASICLRNEWFEESEHLARQVLTMDPAHVWANLVLLRILDLTGRSDEELHLLRSLIKVATLPDQFRRLLSLRIQNSISVRPLVLAELARHDAIVPPPAWQQLGPHRRPVSSRPRLALCISGQLRGFATAAESYAQLRSDFEVDVFVHTWEEVGTFANEEDKRSALLAAIKGANADLPPGIDFDRSNFPECFVIADKPLMDARKVSDFYDATDIVVESGPEFESRIAQHWKELGAAQPAVNECKMLYKINACNKLLKKAIDGGKEYQYVMRARPDLKILADTAMIRRRLVDDSTILGSYIIGGDYNGFSDQLAVGSPRAMDVYAGVWPRLWSHGSGFYGPWFTGRLMEDVIFHHLFASGVRMRVDPRLRGSTILRVPDLLPAMVREALGRDLARIRPQG